MTKTNGPTHVVVDIETMSLASNAAILSIGAVLVGAPGIESRPRTFYTDVDPAWYERTPLGRTFDVSLDTALWWMRQSDAARSALTDLYGTAGVAPELPVVLDAFREYLDACSGGDLSSVVLWGNGAAFDNVIIANAYKTCGVPAPWNFRNDACYRTFKRMHRDVPLDPMGEGEKHHALRDAVHQANHMMKIAAAKNIDFSTL